MRVLHVGYPKTATTYLQREVFRQMRKAGLVRTYIALDSDLDTDFIFELHCALIPEMVPQPELSSGLHDVLATEKFDSFLISDEILLNGGDPTLLAPRALKYFGKNTLVLITFRDPWELFVSSYQQHVKFGWAFDFEAHSKRFTPKLLDVRTAIDIFASKFETVVAVHKDALQNSVWMNEILNQPEQQLPQLALKDVRRNVSLSAKKVREMEEINKRLLPALARMGYERELNIVPWGRLDSRQKFMNFTGRVAQHLKALYATKTSKGRGLDPIKLAQEYPDLKATYPTLERVHRIEVWRRGELAEFVP